MKRVGYLFEKIVDMDNLILAHQNARKGKSHYKEVQWVNANEKEALEKLQKLLVEEKFTTSQYIDRYITDKGKPRKISKLPYYPDRIVHHAVLQIVEPIFFKSLIRDTFQSIKGRGTHDCRKRIQKFLSEHSDEELYFCKIDIKKYYPSIDNSLMKSFVKKKIKCRRTLDLLFDIINSYKGLPIGNYTSQILGNLYLSVIDWFAKQKLRIKGYFRYCDDILLLGTKEFLKARIHRLISEIKELYLHVVYKSGVEPIRKRQGFSFIGFRYNPNIFLKQKTFRNSLKALKSKQLESLASYWGWWKPMLYKGIFANDYKLYKSINITV